MQQAARNLHALGFKTIPIKPGTKTPATKHGVNDATADNAATDAWYAMHPDHGIGVSGEGFVIFDFDVKDGVDGRDELLDWDLPDTLAQTTPSGGYHLFYRTTEDVKPSVNAQKKIDVRGWHSYVVCDPTPGYTFEDDCDIADADETVMAFLNSVRPIKRTTKSTSGKLREGEGRNDALYRYGCSLQSAEHTDEEVAEMMRAYNVASFDPPLERGEVDKCIANVLENIPKGLSADFKKQQETKRTRSRKFNHAAVADALMDENGACFIDGMPAIRHDNVYRIGWNAINREVILRERNATRANQREVQHYLTVMAEQKTQSRPTLIAFKNGVLDITDMTLRDYEQDDVIPNVIPHDWNGDAECDEVDELLKRISCNDLDVYLNLIEVMGVCMYRSSEFTQSAILLGDGSNGKSTYIRMLTALLGKQNISTLSMGMLGKQFLTGRLAGKLANLGSEISNEFKNGDLLSMFKELVDGDRMHADVKGVEGFDFESYATIVMCANEFPRLADYSDGMMRRVFPIEFNARFKKTDPDYNPRIARLVTTEQGCQRMAVLGIMGLQSAIAHNGFTSNAASERRLETIRTDNDTSLAWARAMEWDADGLDGTKTSDHYRHYKEWCMEFGYQAVSHQKFTRQLNKNFELESFKKRVNGVPINCFRKRNTWGKVV